MDSPRLLHPDFWPRRGTGDPSADSIAREAHPNLGTVPAGQGPSGASCTAPQRNRDGGRRGLRWGGQRPRTDLEGIVGRAAWPPPAPVLQLHFRVQLLLILLHDVREVRPPAALRVVIVSMATVWLGQEKRTWMGGRLPTHGVPHPPCSAHSQAQGCVCVSGLEPLTLDGRESQSPSSWGARMAERGPDQAFPLPSLDGGRQRPLLGSGQDRIHTGKHHFSRYRQPLQLRGWTKMQVRVCKHRWPQGSETCMYVASRVVQQTVVGGGQVGAYGV